LKGGHLNHPELEVGTRKRIKNFRFNPNQDIPIKTNESIKDDALDLYRNSTITIK